MADRKDGMSGSDPHPDRKRATPQGPGAAGPGNRHGIPPDDAPGPWGTDKRPFDPAGNKPAANPEEEAREILDQANPGPRAKGNAGPKAAGGKTGQDEG